MATYELGYKTYSELSDIGIRSSISKGLNDLGLMDRTIICIDGTVWNYNAEDSIYERDYDAEWELSNYN